MDPPELTPRSEILRLALPAFLTLVAEPLFLLADSAIVGHLGTPQLAGLGVAGAAMATAVNLFIFLAYGTTSVVARQIGAGARRGAVETGFDGLWLALVIGGVVGVGVAAFAGPVCGVFGASPEVLGQARTYLQISALGIPAMLVTLAVTGVLRGLQDTRTPLVVSVLAFSANVALNLAFVYGLGLGIAGSAWGTVMAQTGMALALVTAVTGQARRLGARLRPHPARVLRAARDGIPLMVRTIALRATLLTATWVAARLGDVPLAAYQVSMTVWMFLAFALDALAIAAQALTGRSLGAGDVAGTRAMTALMVRWGVGAGVVFGLVVAGLYGVLPALFTEDPATRLAIGAALLTVAVAQPISGWVFVLDGVLIGAGDNRFLAWAQSVAFAVYVPAALVTSALGARTGNAGMAVQWLWWGIAVWMLVRGVLLQCRASSGAWLRTGAVAPARSGRPDRCETRESKALAVECRGRASSSMTSSQPHGVRDDGPLVPVVAGVDGTDNDGLVLAWAAAEAQRLGVGLLAVHALDLPSGAVAGGLSDRHEILATVRLERRGEAVRHALERVRTTHPDVETSMVDRWGTPAQELVALSGRAAVVVVGGGRKSGLEKVAVGSTSFAVAMHAHCPVVLVRAHTLPPASDATVVVGVDGSRYSTAAIEYAFGAAQRRGVALTCVAAWGVEVVDGVVVTTAGTSAWRQVEEHYGALVEAAIRESRQRHPDVPVVVAIAQGTPTSVLGRWSQRAALLVVGTRGRGGFTGMLLGSVSHRLLQTCACPVAVVKPHRG